MAHLSDTALHALVARDPERGWQVFVEQHTDLLVALIERAGVVDRDTVTEVYVIICERLAGNGCARLRTFDPARGPLAAWLTIVARHAVVDWLRAQHGRRRPFAAIEQLDAGVRRVFELYYWEHRSAGEITETLTMELGRRVGLGEVLDALASIERTLTDRHRAELLAQLARAGRPISLDVEDAPLHLRDRRPNPEETLAARERNAALARALRALPAEDAVIARLTFVHGWSRAAVRRALGLEALSPDRIEGIVRDLRSRLVPDAAGSTTPARVSIRKETS